MDLAEVGEMSIGSEAGGAGGEDLVEVGADAAAEGRIGMDFGREVGDRWSVGNALRGRDSVVAMSTVVDAMQAMEMIVMKRIRPARPWQWEPSEEDWKRSSDVNWEPARCHHPLRTPINVVEWRSAVGGLDGL
jgi:hypothetical protein